MGQCPWKNVVVFPRCRRTLAGRGGTKDVYARRSHGRCVPRRAKIKMKNKVLLKFMWFFNVLIMFLMHKKWISG